METEAAKPKERKQHDNPFFVVFFNQNKRKKKGKRNLVKDGLN